MINSYIDKGRLHLYNTVTGNIQCPHHFFSRKHYCFFIHFLKGMKSKVEEYLYTRGNDVCKT